VIRRILDVQKRPKDEQEENVLHSRCNIYGKVCSFILGVWLLSLLPRVIWMKSGVT